MSLSSCRAVNILCLAEIQRCCPRSPVHTGPLRHARYFSRSTVAQSGHSKWASIKHDKGKADAARAKQRNLLVKDITNAVKLSGPDPTTNPRLALTIATAKKNAVPKAAMEAAIARGQGLSATGAALENVTMEAMLPPNVAVVIECQTDARLKTLADLRLLIKDAGGNVSPVGYMFEKKGRIVLQRKVDLSADDVLDPALDAGALDVTERDDGSIVLWTEPASTKSVADELAAKLKVDIEESEIVYDPNEDTKVALDDEEAAADLGKFLDALTETPGLQGVYINWSQGSVDDAQWAELQNKLP